MKKKPVYVVVDSTVDGIPAGDEITIDDPTRLHQLVWGGHVAIKGDT